MQSEVLEHSSTGNIQKREKSKSGWILVRLDQEDLLPTIVPQAQAVAFGLGRQLRLIEILESDRATTFPADPVEWDMRRREAQLHLARLADHYTDERCAIETRVLERFLPEEAGGCDSETMPILGFGRRDGELPWQLDAANRHFLESCCSSILMVPDHTTTSSPVMFSRLMVPLDGSSRAESALPTALKIAQQHGAELLIAHVAPEVALTESGPLEAEALVLKRQVESRNRRVAADYLSRIRARFVTTNVAVNTRILEGGDVRRQLNELARVQSCDLIVMASHGAGGHGDVLSGSVATFVLEHAPVPVLMVGRETDHGKYHLYAESSSEKIRRPADLARYE